MYGRDLGGMMFSFFVGGNISAYKILEDNMAESIHFLNL